jgi:hypothetical protein
MAPGNQGHGRLPEATPARPIIAAMLGAALLAGCTTSSNLLSQQSRFAYSNGDYVPLGRVSAERKYTKVFTSPVMGREEFLELESQALATKPGADLMVDYLVSSDVTQVPLPFLPIVTFTTFRVEGTALRFTELGRQQFRDSQPPAAASPRVR